LRAPGCDILPRSSPAPRRDRPADRALRRGSRSTATRKKSLGRRPLPEHSPRRETSTPRPASCTGVRQPPHRHQTGCHAGRLRLSLWVIESFTGWIPSSTASFSRRETRRTFCRAARSQRTDGASRRIAGVDLLQVAGLAVVVWRRVCALLSGRARLAPSHPSIASRATTARLFRPRSLPPGRTNLIVRFPAARHARRHGHEGLKWVESGGSVAVMQTAAIGALPPMAAEGRVGSDPAGVRPNRDSPQLPQMRH
jgi:hypothetical protein